MLSSYFMDKHWAIPDWHEHASCRGYDINLFFPDYNGGKKAFAIAKQICQSCPVIAECLDNQLKLESFDDQWGMFGGKTPQERKEIRYKRDRRL